MRSTPLQGHPKQNRQVAIAMEAQQAEAGFRELLLSEAAAVKHWELNKTL